MAEFNRYDNISVSKFDPMSYQEIMAPAAMMRGRHDQLAAQQEALRQGLAKVDPLDVHYNEALKYKNDINNQINSQAELLAKEGFNPNSTSQFIQLNRKYNDLISPTGKLGQINAAKQVYNKQLEDYVEDATKNKGWSREVALANWQNNVQKPYTGFDNNGNITNVGSYGAPKYVDVSARVQDYAKQVGLTTEEFANASGALQFDQAGNRYVVNKDSKNATSSNINQLQALANLMTRELSDPSSETRRSVDFSGRNPNTVLQDIQSQLGIYRTDKTSRESGYSVGSVNWSKPDENDPSGMIISNDSTLRSDAIGVPTFNGVKESINKLTTSPSLSPADRAKLDDLQELKAAAEVKMLKDPEYNKALKEYNEAKKAVPKKDDNSMYRYDPKQAEGFNRVKRAESKLNEIQDNYWKQSSSMRHNYSYLPSTPKEESVWNLHNENVFNTLRGVGDLGNVLDLTSIHTTGGTKKNLSSSDTKNVQDLLKNGDPKSFKINNIKTYGDNKTPEITMTFNTLKGAKEYDTDGLNLSMDGIIPRSLDEYGGEEKPVTVTFKLKRLSNAPDTGSAAGFKNLTGAIAGFYKDKGGRNEITGNHQGSEVYTSLIENAYKDVSNEELYARAQTDSDAREALMIRVAKRQKK